MVSWFSLEKSLSSLNKEIGLGILGLGTVGTGVIELLHKNGRRLADSVGRPLVVKRAGVSAIGPRRPLPESLITTDVDSVVHSPGVDIFVEVMGGEHLALDLMLAALYAGKPVVTANKLALAKHWNRLMDAASSTGVPICFEAAVAGGVPIIRTMAAHLVGAKVTRIEGILNGTTNYMLTAMASGRSYKDVLEEAQRLGYAEADPTSDVEGWDALYKIAILAALARREMPEIEKIRREGITHLTQEDFESAAIDGQVIKLVARADLAGTEPIISVQPRRLPHAHPLAGIDGVMNGVLVETSEAGSLFLSGPGAGAGPTATSVVSGIVEAAKWLPDPSL